MIGIMQKPGFSTSRLVPLAQHHLPSGHKNSSSTQGVLDVGSDSSTRVAGKLLLSEIGMMQKPGSFMLHFVPLAQQVLPSGHKNSSSAQGVLDLASDSSTRLAGKLLLSEIGMMQKPGSLTLHFVPLAQQVLPSGHKNSSGMQGVLDPSSNSSATVAGKLLLSEIGMMQKPGSSTLHFVPLAQQVLPSGHK